MYTYVRMHIPACWRSSIAQWLRTQALEPDFLVQILTVPLVSCVTFYISNRSLNSLRWY